MILPEMGALWMTTFATDEDTEHRLIESAKAGDSDAFGKLMVLHGRMVLRVAQRILLDAEEAKDVAQEVFLKLHRSLREFDARKQLTPWLYRITVNLCRDRMRRTKRDVRLDALELAAHDNPEQNAMEAQRYQLAVEALRYLSPREREAIVLRDFESKSIPEVAELLGVSEATIRSQLSTGRTKMKDYIVAKTNRSRL